MTVVAAQSQANAIAEQLTGRDYVSFSAINTYASCPLRYFFKYVQGLPEHTVSSTLVFGGAIHSALELHFNELMAGGPAPSHEELLVEFWAAWRDRNEDVSIKLAKGEDAKSVGELASRVLKAFQAGNVAKPGGRILGVEEELRGGIVSGVPEVLVRIDLIVETGNALVVTDFKTARSRWSDGQAQHQAEQLLLYSELARQLAPGKELRLEYAVVTKAKFPTFERHPVQIDRQRIARTKQVVRRVWQAIEAGHFYPAPSPLSCPSCPYREPCRDWTG